MNDYIETRLTVTPCSEVATDLLAALLAEIGYESFVPDPSGLTAFVPAKDFDPQALDKAVGALPLPGVKTVVENTKVEGKDWNEEWEKNYFKPILIDGRCVVHSSFHTDIPAADFDIVIDPKMAFGTGHHQTTTLILRRLLDLPLAGMKMLDMGTGTGILAILGAMRGANPVTAVEIDPPAYDNAVDNVVLNRQPQIEVILGDASAIADISDVDILTANINRNVITADIGAYAKTLAPNATVLLSGFYITDVPIVTAAAEAVGLSPVGYTSLDNWACLQLTAAKL